MIFKKRISLKEPQFTGVGGYTYMKLWHYTCLYNGIDNTWLIGILTKHS